MDNPVLQVVVFAVPMLVLAFFGMALGVVYKRSDLSGSTYSPSEPFLAWVECPY